MAIDQRSEVLDKVRKLAATHLKGLDVKLVLFGSWARRQEQTSSDIDIAIWYDRALPPGTLADLREAYEESSIPYRAEVVDLTEVDAEYFVTLSCGRRSNDRLALSLQVARKALTSLQELAVIQFPSTVERDASIHRFEYTFEALWKAAKHYLREKEGLEPASPKSIVRSCREVGLLKFTAGCLHMRKSWMRG